jgi:hypothetical protein
VNAKRLIDEATRGIATLRLINEVIGEELPALENTLASLKALYAEDKLPGGVGDGRSPSEFDPAELAKGIEVEMEHTDDRTLAREIAIDHLSEDPHYYTKLATIHDEARACRRRRR